MVKITYENFQDIDYKYAKFISQSQKKILLNIINFDTFRDELLNKYSELEIKHFFTIYPHSLFPVMSEQDIMIGLRLEIEYYDDLHMVEFDRKEYILVDEASEFFEDWVFLEKIESQPIALDDFIKIFQREFIDMCTGALLHDIEYNLREKNKEKSKKYVETGIKQGIYI